MYTVQRLVTHRDTISIVRPQIYVYNELFTLPDVVPFGPDASRLHESARNGIRSRLFARSRNDVSANDVIQLRNGPV